MIFAGEEGEGHSRQRGRRQKKALTRSINSGTLRAGGMPEPVWPSGKALGW